MHISLQPMIEITLVYISHVERESNVKAHRTARLCISWPAFAFQNIRFTDYIGAHLTVICYIVISYYRAVEIVAAESVM